MILEHCCSISLFLSKRTRLSFQGLPLDVGAFEGFEEKKKRQKIVPGPGTNVPLSEGHEAVWRVFYLMVLEFFLVCVPACLPACALRPQSRVH